MYFSWWIKWEVCFSACMFNNKAPTHWPMSSKVGTEHVFITHPVHEEQTNSKFISYHYVTILSDPVLWPRDRQNSEHFAPKHNIASSLDKVCGHYPQCTKVYLRPPKLLMFLDWTFHFFTHCFYSVCCLIWYLSSTFLLHYTLLLFPTS